MSLQQYWQTQNSFFDLSAGSINKLGYCNYFTDPQQEEFDGAKVRLSTRNGQSLVRGIF